MSKITTEDFIKRAKEIHGDTYDYSLSEYVARAKAVKIICQTHGVFEQSPGNHYAGKGCKFCSNNVNFTTEQFIEKAQKVHGDRFDYSLVDYKNNRINIKIICPEHGVFKQIPSRHLTTKGCLKCTIIERAKSSAGNLKDFIKAAKQVHGDRYDYSQVNYIKSRNDVTIICKKHGEFRQRCSHHTGGSGCPSCRTSIGENKVKSALKKSGIIFKTQHSFEDCRHKCVLRFDFYIPETNTCIEYNGEQHYRPIEFFGGKKSFIKQQKRDQVKKNYCHKKGINLMIIKYDECIKTKINELKKRAA